ncbi:ABC transporter permease [Rhodococcus sp. NPDC056516]|uniref:ABC transporter permease n=1 Tax=Rhodococcus sp. NPDC056516 TaxID=3345847 RepID=UPI00366EE5C8
MATLTAVLRRPSFVFRNKQGPSLGTTLALLFTAIALVAVAAPSLLTGVDPNATNPAAPFAGPGSAHWFGTDNLGRDIFSRVVHGARFSLLIGLGATAVAVLLGTLVGISAVLGPRWVRAGLLRMVDITMAFPDLLLTLLVIAVLGPGPRNTLIAVALGMVPRFARVIRAQTLPIAASGYVESAVALGTPRRRIVGLHILPNALLPLVAVATISVGTAIISVASLSFLGLGVRPPDAEWGVMLAQGREFLRLAWWASLFPGLAVVLTVVSITTLGRHAQRRLAERGLA